MLQSIFFSFNVYINHSILIEKIKYIYCIFCISNLSNKVIIHSDCRSTKQFTMQYKEFMVASLTDCTI